MDESVIKHLEQAVEVTKLSEAVRVGASRYRQIRLFVDGDGGYCAMCGAIKVLGGDPDYIWGNYYGEGVFQWLEGKTGTPAGIVMSGSNMHFLGADSIAVADWLEAQGY